MKTIVLAVFVLMCWLPIGSDGAQAQPAEVKSPPNPFDNPEAFKPEPVKTPPTPKSVMGFVRITDISDDPEKFVGATLNTSLRITSSSITIEKIRSKKDGGVVLDGALLSVGDGSRPNRESFGNQFGLIADELAIVIRSKPMARLLSEKLTTEYYHKCDAVASVEKISDEDGNPITALVIKSVEFTVDRYVEGQFRFEEERVKISEEQFADRK